MVARQNSNTTSAAVNKMISRRGLDANPNRDGSGLCTVFSAKRLPHLAQKTESASMVAPQAGHFLSGVFVSDRRVPQAGQKTASACTIFPQEGHCSSGFMIIYSYKDLLFVVPGHVHIAGNQYRYRRNFFWTVWHVNRCLVRIIMFHIVFCQLFKRELYAAKDMCLRQVIGEPYHARGDKRKKKSWCMPAGSAFAHVPKCDSNHRYYSPGNCLFTPISIFFLTFWQGKPK